LSSVHQKRLQLALLLVLNLVSSWIALDSLQANASEIELQKQNKYPDGYQFKIISPSMLCYAFIG
jgi:hypothetical protein